MPDENYPNRDQRNEEPPPKSIFRDLFNFFSLTGFLYGPLDERLNFRAALEKQLTKLTPPHKYKIDGCFFSCLGGISFSIFLVQLVTGVLLLMYYRPTTDQAYSSIVMITNDVQFGWLVRGLHHWGSNVMVITVFMHMFKVYLTGAYKTPREFNWVVGVCLLLITLAFAFSGYLLPWNQISYWATTVGTDSASAVPVIGEQLRFFARGGPQVGQITLTRFFALHVVILPFVAFLLLTMHFLMIRRQGISEPL